VGYLDIGKRPAWGEMLSCWGFLGYFYGYTPFPDIPSHVRFACLQHHKPKFISSVSLMETWTTMLLVAETCARWLVGHLFWKEVWRLNSWFKDDLNQRCEEKTCFSHQKTCFFGFSWFFSMVFQYNMSRHVWISDIAPDPQMLDWSFRAEKWRWNHGTSSIKMGYRWLQ